MCDACECIFVICREKKKCTKIRNICSEENKSNENKLEIEKKNNNNKQKHNKKAPIYITKIIIFHSPIVLKKLQQQAGVLCCAYVSSVENEDRKKNNTEYLDMCTVYNITTCVYKKKYSE